MADRAGICLKTKIASKGTKITLKPVMNPLREAVVKTNPQAWVKKAVKRKKPVMIPGFRDSPEKVFLRVHPKGRRNRQEKKKRMKRRFAGVVSPSASLMMAKEVPQKTETPSKTASAIQ
jgi:hypothetical protein